MLIRCLGVAALIACASAAGQADPSSIKLPLHRRGPGNKLSMHQHIKRTEAHLMKRYGEPRSKAPLSKRAVDAPVIQSFQLVDDVVVDQGPNIEIQIGANNPQTVLAVADTGSYDLNVFAPGSLNGSHTFFDQTASSSFAVLNKTPTVSEFGSGNVTGFLGSDVVSIQGLSVSNQSLLVNTGSSLANPGTVNSLNAIFGLAPNVGDLTGNGPSWLQNAIQQGLINGTFAFSPLATGRDSQLAEFQLHLNTTAGTAPDFTLYEQTSVTLELGGYNTSYDSSLHWAEVLTPQLWAVQMDSISLRGAPVAGTQTPVIIDSGTSSIVMPTAIAEQLAASIGGQVVTFNDTPGSDLLGGSVSWISAPCATEPFTLAVTLANHTFGIDVQDLFAGTLDADGFVCLLNINTLRSEPTVAILGDVFLKHVYSVFSLPQGVPTAIGFSSPDGIDTVFPPVSLADLASKSRHAGLLATDGRPQSAVNGDFPTPGLGVSKQRMLRRRR